MTSLENRNSSALFKRAEQLKRWSESDTNREPNEPKRKSQRIQFTDGCVFLAACAASDKDEVERLIKRGADIDTANIDGLTALHQVRPKSFEYLCQIFCLRFIKVKKVCVALKEVFQCYLKNSFFRRRLQFSKVDQKNFFRRLIKCIAYDVCKVYV